MNNTALAFEGEYGEVPVSSVEVVEANVAALRDGLNEVKKDVKSLMEKMDQNFERLWTRMEARFDATNARIDSTNRELGQLAQTHIRTDTKLNAVLWVFAVLGALVPIGFSVGKALHWF